MALWALRCTILGGGPMQLIRQTNMRAWLKPSRRRTRVMALAQPIADRLF
jgi:hypothetical protein